MTNFNRQRLNPANPPGNLAVNVKISGEVLLAFLSYYKWSGVDDPSVVAEDLLVRGLMERKELPNWWLKRNRVIN